MGSCMTEDANDRRFMMAAASLARRGLGRVWPNPSVGTLIVRKDEAGDSMIVARGVTGLPGTGHAEARALQDAGELARGATCYVTLEPCSHFGRTPPCSLALINAGVSRVVIGMKDPNPRVAGRGIAMLEEAGVEVVLGVALDVIERLHAGFVSRISHQLPQVTLKIALSADGGLGLRDAKPGEAQVHLTGPLSNARVHAARAIHDAIMIGIGTALGDDPSLTCRLPGMADCSPVRVVIDSRARLPLSSTLVKTAADVPVWLLVTNAADPDRLEALAQAGVLIIKVPGDTEGHIDPKVALAALSARGITSVLLEGGGAISDSFEASGLVDRICLIHTPVTIGENRLLPFGGRPLETVLSNPSYQRQAIARWGEDVFVEYRKV